MITNIEMTVSYVESNFESFSHVSLEINLSADQSPQIKVEYNLKGDHLLVSRSVALKCKSHAKYFWKPDNDTFEAALSFILLN